MQLLYKLIHGAYAMRYLYALVEDYSCTDVDLTEPTVGTTWTKAKLTKGEDKGETNVRITVRYSHICINGKKLARVDVVLSDGLYR